MSAPTVVSLADLGDFPLPRLGAASDKDERGRVFVVAGGALAPGAAILTGVAALRVGAGKLQMATTAGFAVPLAFAVPEAAVLTVPGSSAGDMGPSAAAAMAESLGRVDAAVVGPGMMDEAAAGDLARRLLATPTEAGFVLDAAAMTGLRLTDPPSRAAGRMVLTPHAGEMAALTGRSRAEVEGDPLDAARLVAAALKAVVVMKGGATHIVSPDGRAWLHLDGVVGLGTSGSGDVLAGLIGGLLARGCSPLTAATWGVCLHGGAGARLSQRLGPLGFLAREILDEIPGLMAVAAPAP